MKFTLQNFKERGRSSKKNGKKRICGRDRKFFNHYQGQRLGDQNEKQGK